MVLNLPWCLDEWRVDGVVMTRHAVLVVPASLVGTVDEDRDVTDSARSCLITRLTPCRVRFRSSHSLDDRQGVRAVVGVQQSHAGTIVETMIEVDGLHAQVKAVEERQERRKYVGGSLAGFQPADRQRATFCLFCTRTYTWHRRETRRSGFRLAVVETLCLVFVTVVGIEVEVVADLHRLIEKRVENVSLKGPIANLLTVSQSNWSVR